MRVAGGREKRWELREQGEVKGRSWKRKQVGKSGKNEKEIIYRKRRRVESN